MVEIQVGSTKQPIIIIPRIDGVVVTVTQIKNTFSNFFVDDLTTPIDFKLEFKTRIGAKTLINYDVTRSSDTEIWFLPDNSFYAAVVKYSVLVYWTIGVEKVYLESPLLIDVKDLHNES